MTWSARTSPRPAPAGRPNMGDEECVDPESGITRTSWPLAATGPAAMLFGYLTDPGSGHGRDIGTWIQPDRVQHGGPRRAAGLQCGHDRVRPAGDHPVPVLITAVDMAEGPVRAGCAPGRSPDGLPAARTNRAPAALGSGRPVSARRSRSKSIRPSCEPAVQSSVPQWCSGPCTRSTGVLNQPSVQRRVSISSNNASELPVRHAEKSARNCDNGAGDSLRPRQRTHSARPCPTSTWSRRGETLNP